MLHYLLPVTIPNIALRHIPMHQRSFPHPEPMHEYVIGRRGVMGRRVDRGMTALVQSGGIFGETVGRSLRRMDRDLFFD
jgi:hypothetical protein